MKYLLTEEQYINEAFLLQSIFTAYANKIGKKKKDKIYKSLEPDEKIVFGLTDKKLLDQKIYKIDNNKIIEIIKEFRNNNKNNDKIFKSENSFIKSINTYLNNKLKYKIPILLVTYSYANKVLFRYYKYSITDNIIPDVPIINGAYFFPLWTKEKIIIAHNKNINYFFQHANDSLFNKYLDLLKIILEHEMIHRAQFLHRGEIKTIGLSGILGMLFGIAPYNYYGLDIEIEAHAATTVRFFQNIGLTKNEVIELINSENQAKKSIIAPSYSYIDYNKYFSKKDKVWKDYIEFVNKYTELYYK